MKAKFSKKQTAINLTANIFSYGVSIAISFLLTPYLISKIGKDAYSFYPMANTFLNYMVIITSALNTVASRFITINIAKNNETEAKKYFTAAFLSESIVGLSLLIPMAIIVVFLDKIMNVPINYLPAIRILFATIFASGLVNVVSSTLGVATFSKNRIDLRSWRELAAALLRAVLCILAYVLLPASIFYIGVIALLVALFNVAVQFFYTKKLLPGFLFNKERPQKSHIIILVKSSIWSIILSLGSLFLSGMTTIFANIFYGETVSGTFSIVLTIPGFLNGLISLLVGIFYPQLSYAVAEGDNNKISKIIRSTSIIVGGFSAAVIAVFGSISSTFFSLWVPGENNIELFYLSLLAMGSYLGVSVFWIFNSLFIAFNKIKIPAITTLIFGIINMCIMMLFGFLNIPYWTLLLLSFIIQTVWSSIFMPLYGKKITNIELKPLYTVFAKCLLFGFFCFSVLFATSVSFPINSWLTFILYALVAGPLSLFFIYFLLDSNYCIEIIKKIKYKLIKK